MRKPRRRFDSVAERAVDRFFSSFQRELEIACLKFRLAALERSQGYHHPAYGEVLGDLKEKLERGGRREEALALIDRAGRIIVSMNESSDRQDMVMGLLMRTSA